MELSVSRLVERLHEEKEKTTAFFQAVPVDAWENIVYSENAAWTVRDLLAHFVATESAITSLVRNILAGGSGSTDDFELDKFNQDEVEHYRSMESGQLLSSFQSLREATIQMIQNITSSDLSRVGRHPYLGLASVEEIIKLLYRHNQIHQRDIRRTLGS